MNTGVATVRDITKRVTKGTTPTSIGAGFASEGVNFVKVESITAEGRVDSRKVAHIDLRTHAMLARSVLEEDDLLFTIAGTIGRVARVRADLLPANTNQAVAIVRPDTSKVDVGYLFYALRAKEGLDHARSRLVQSVQANLSLADLSDMEIPLPSLHEQRGIAEVLGALDDKIATNAILVASAEALMTTLAALAVDMATVASLASHSTTSARPENFDKEVAHYSLPAFDVAARPEIAQRTSIKSNKFVVGRPSVLMSKLNPRIPRIWDVPVLPDRMALSSTEFVVLQPLNVDTTVLWAALSHPEVSANLSGKVAGTSGSHQRVKPAELLSLSIRDPRTLSGDIQESIATAGLILHGRREESAKLADIRDALLPQLMSGKIRVKDAERVVEGVV